MSHIAKLMVQFCPGHCYHLTSVQILTTRLDRNSIWFRFTSLLRLEGLANGLTGTTAEDELVA